MRDVGSAKSENDRGNQPDQSDTDSREQRLSHDGPIVPSPFAAAWIERLRTRDPQRALDVAMGRGRHTLPLARAGYRTFGVDRRLDAVRDAAERAREAGLTIAVWCADLASFPLPPRRFDLLVVTRYLQRDLFGAIQDAVAPGGAVIYETFTVAQRDFGVGPMSPDHLLRPGELRERFERFDILFYEEVNTTEAVARLVARRPATMRD
jgi:tellurite methyltransferase